jgi:uracil permease
MESSSGSRDILYGLDQWPPLGALILLALQWLVVLVPGVLVLGDLFSSAMHLEPVQRVGLIQRLFIICGLVQVLQILVGHRLPAVMGPASTLLAGVVAGASTTPGALFGAMALGGVLTALLGLLGLAASLRRLFTPAVLAATLMLIPVSLTPGIRDMIMMPDGPGASWGLSLWYALGLSVLMLWAQAKLKGIWSSAVLFLGLVAGALLWNLIGLGGLAEARVWTLPTGAWLSNLFPYTLELRAGPIGALLLCYLALIANELATVEALSEISGADGVVGRLNRGTLYSGLGGIAAGLMGAIGPVSYAVSPGVVIASRSLSRFPLAVAGLVMVGFGLWPTALGLFGLVPSPVVGAVLFTTMSGQIYASLRMTMAPGQVLDWPTGIVIGGSVMTGICVSFMPPEMKNVLHPLLRAMASNGFVLGLLFALVLEHMVFRRR